MAPSPALLEELAALAAEVATEAGAYILAAQQRGAENVTTKSAANDYVSDADHGSERLIVEALRRARPDDGLLGEEGTVAAGTTGFRWVIDPLDGTTNYLLGRSDYAVSIGVEHNGTPVAGAVHRPVPEELYIGAVGTGATLNGKPITPRETLGLTTATISFGCGGGTTARSQMLRIVAEIPQVGDIRRIGAGASEVVAVASGHLDAYIQHGDQPWDLVGGTAIALAAGAETHHTHVAGLHIGVVTAPGVRDELLATLNRIQLP